MLDNQAEIKIKAKEGRRPPQSNLREREREKPTVRVFCEAFTGLC